MRHLFSTFALACRRGLVVAGVVLALALPSPAPAIQPDELLDDPVLESRARSISAELRCMVCQNESIDESNADLARDLRLLVRERLLEGDSNDEVIAFMVDRYGEFVLLTPRVGWHTAVLWGAPAIFLLFGGLIALRVFSTHRRFAATAGAPAELSDAEQKKLADILDRDG